MPRNGFLFNIQSMSRVELEQSRDPERVRRWMMDKVYGGLGHLLIRALDDEREYVVCVHPITGRDEEHYISYSIAVDVFLVNPFEAVIGEYVKEGPPLDDKLRMCNLMSPDKKEIWRFQKTKNAWLRIS